MRRTTRSVLITVVAVLTAALFVGSAPAGAVPATPSVVTDSDLGLSTPPGSGEETVAPLGTGLSIFYDLELRNAGPAAADAQLTISLPTGLELGPGGVGRYASESGFFAQQTPSPVNCTPTATAGQFTCDAGTVAAATTADPPIIEIELLANSSGAPGVTAPFTVSVAPATGTDTNAANDQVQGSVLFTGIADLDYTITPGTAGIPVGGAARLTLTVTNHGPQPATGAIAVSLLQSGLHFGITGFDGNLTPPGASPFARAAARKSAVANVSRAAVRMKAHTPGLSAAAAPPQDAGMFWFIGTIASGASATAHLTVTGKSVGSELLALIAASDAADTGCVAPTDPCTPALAMLSATPAVTAAYIASSRVRSAVYINGLVKQTAFTGLVRGAGRTVYLQRFINGAWQNMLARPTGTSGQFAVGFIQSQVFAYRLYVLASPGGRAGATAITFR